MTTEPLYSFQREAVDRAAKGEAIYLGFDPGLGKSRTALQTAMNRGSTRLLIICPASGRYVWEAETRKWWPGRRISMVTAQRDLFGLKGQGIFVITYGLISQKESPFVSMIAKGEAFDMTVIDEAAAVKNSGANRTRAILGKMLPKLGYVLPLSGTPAPNHAGELYPILKALYPDAIKSPINGHLLRQWEFEDVFCKVVKKRFGGGREVRVIEGSKNIDELRRRIAPFMMRVKKEDVLKDLPPVRYDVVPIQVSPVALPASIPVGLSDEELLKWLTGTGGDQHVMRIRRILGVAKVASAIEYIDEFMQNLPNGKKLLVFAHHKEVIHSLFEGLGDWSPVVITGASSPTERTYAVDRFLGKTKPNSRLMIGNIQAAGTGLTLVGPNCDCSDVIFVEASYAVGDNVQAAARVHRIGQKNAVVARFLTAHGTIDDRIQDILARKAKDFYALFN